MGISSPKRGSSACGLCYATLLGALAMPCVTSAAPAENRAKTKHAVALTPWEQANRVRAEFEAQAPGTHTKAGYNRVLEAFRAIYHDNPRDPHAPEAVNAVAELLGEQGREFDDSSSLRNAVGQYEFLRTQYPASPLRTPALLAEARIEQQDLDDAPLAREKYEALLHEAPHSKAAAEARTSLAELPHAKPAATTRHAEAATRAERAAQGLSLTDDSARAMEEAKAHPAASPLPLPEARQPVAPPPEVATVEPTPATLPAAPPASGPVDPPPTHTVSAPRSGRPLAQVTSIRHWSTSTYTRVAIDLGDQVTFEAARVPNPDRIYFDLHGTHLSPELAGKSFAVTDDGFLKRIRAAQSSPDVTRVVLDVNDVTEYSAFLLPNPYRLIIDIHGARSKPPPLTAGATQPPAPQPAAPIAAQPIAPADTLRASAAANTSGLPPMAPTAGGEAARPPAPTYSQRPVPNTVAVKAPATTTEVAAVSLAPGKVEATNAPTSSPIAANVPTPREVNLGTSRRKRARASDTTLAGASAAGNASPAKAADKTADGETSLIRALGLRINRIVIDPGHGGHDSGTLGVGGIEEKDVVLDVALRLGKLLHDRLGAEIIYTRSDDTFVPLETRTAIANKAQADLFLSIHANSSPDPTARGVETYFLNFTSDPTALDVAARENAVSGESVHQLSDLVKKIALKDKIAESHEFASDVESSLYAGLARGNDGLKNRGVKKAPFVVLIGANMPSILAEISFVSNPKDAAQLRTPEYRERVAESLFNGVARYENGLAGARQPAPIVRAAAQ
jgi:N-acetylmuramoyl-L-alanine amidase